MPNGEAKLKYFASSAANGRCHLGLQSFLVPDPVHQSGGLQFSRPNFAVHANFRGGCLSHNFQPHITWRSG